MTSIKAIKKQIAALEAEVARITKAETAAAIAKIKEIMSSFGLTAEHLGLAVARGKRAGAKKAAPKRAGAGTAKYADPKTGKTWSGFGRVPAWIAGAKSRDAFLVDKSGLEAIAAVTQAPVASKKAAVKAAKAAKPAKPAKKSAPAKAARAAKKATAVAVPVVATKKTPTAKKAAPAKAAPSKAAAKKGSPKAAAKKSASKKKPLNGTAAPQAATEAAAASAA